MLSEAPGRSRLDTVCVYCGSANGSDPVFVEAARTLGRALAEDGIGLVYGGGGHGLMGTLAGTVLEHGGRVTGIIPRSLVQYAAKKHDNLEHIHVADMHARKRMMFDKADAFVALPGGIGTLEELTEQLTWSRLGHHAKPVLLLDVEGFWQPFVTLLDHMRRHQFIAAPLELRYLIADNVEGALSLLKASVTCADPCGAES